MRWRDELLETICPQPPGRAWHGDPVARHSDGDFRCRIQLKRKDMKRYLTINEWQVSDSGAVCDRCLKEILDRMLLEDDSE